MVELKVEENPHFNFTRLLLFDTDTDKEVGHISINDAGHITGLEVLQEYQHKGLGSKLLVEAETMAKSKYKVMKISLSCFDYRLSFYLDRGYTCQNARKVLNEMIKNLGEENE